MTRYPTNRERLMDAASELFYREGLHAITADRVADSAGLTKPTIYNLFGSKDALVFETLHRRGAQIRLRIEQRVAEHEDPERKLLEVLQVHSEMLTSEGFPRMPARDRGGAGAGFSGSARARSRSQDVASRAARPVCAASRPEIPRYTGGISCADPRRCRGDVGGSAPGSRRQARACSRARADRRP